MVSLVLLLSMEMDQTLMVSQVLDLELPWQSTQPGSVIYYTDSVLGIGSTVVVDPPTSTNVAYTQYSEISVDENVDFIVAEGDDFVPDILGIGTVRYHHINRYWW